MIPEEKSELRRYMRRIRRDIAMERGEDWGPKERDLFFELLSRRQMAFEGPVLSFFPLGNEPRLLPFEGDGPWYFPRVAGASLEWFPWAVHESLPPLSPLGLPEAAQGVDAATLVGSSEPLICFVPALAADAEGFRLGYGGGFYDRFLAQPGLRERIFAVTVLDPKLIVPSLPRETHDSPVDALLTADGLTLTPKRRCSWWLS